MVRRVLKKSLRRPIANGKSGKGFIMGRFFQSAALASSVMWFIAVTAGAGPLNMVHGEPDFDSGWRPTTGAFLRIPHGLTGPVEDFVWDVQLREPLGEASAGVTLIGIGGDRYGTGTTESAGARVLKVDDSDVYIAAGASASTTQAKVRIWKVPNPAYDSGWVPINPGGVAELMHNLGGDPEAYLVDLTMRNGSSIHQRYLGGDVCPGASSPAVGAYWSDLDANGIKVRRLNQDGDCPEIRIRIFVPPAPDYDSGWVGLAAGTGINLEHGVGGPWNDLYVDYQSKGYGMGTHIKAVGGDRQGAAWAGASWTALTGSTIRLWRFSNDVYAEQVRVRIWASRRPAYDSGWTPVGLSSDEYLVHGLGGDPGDYVVDLQFNDADGSIGAGINTYKYGGDWMYNFATETYDGRGSGWFGLDDTGVTVTRLADDLSAEQARVRIWRGAAPDWDSGWEPVSQGETLSLAHDLGVSPAALVVDLQYRNSIGTGVNHLAFGGDQWFDTGTASYAMHGAYWRALTHNSVEVKRHTNDLYAEEVRVRIWKNNSFEAVHTDLNADTGATAWEHGLDVDPEDLVVYLFANGTSATYGYHQYQYGGDRKYYGGWVRSGAWWENLGSSSITVWRALDDLQSNDVFVRLWWTGGREEHIFSDGFESGSTAAWTSP